MAAINHLWRALALTIAPDVMILVLRDIDPSSTAKLTVRIDLPRFSPEQDLDLTAVLVDDSFLGPLSPIWTYNA